MQEQITEPITVNSEFSLNQAINDLRFYWGLARHKGVAFHVEIWAERGVITVPQLIPIRRTDEPRPSLHLVREVPND